jgi:hypothetical protein
LLLLLGVFALAGVLILAEAARQWVHLYVLSTHYAETQGRVMGREMDLDEATTYYVTYRFVAGDEEHTVKESVNRSTYDGVEEGGSLHVRYAPRDPEIATIEPGQLGDLPILTLFGLGWSGFVFLIGRPLVGEVRKRHRLAREGRRVAGQVMRSYGRRDRDGDYHLELWYHFVSPQTGSRIEDGGSQLRQDLADQPLPPPGTPVQVLFVDNETYLVL